MMTTPDQTPASDHGQLVWLDELCDRFEAAWGTPDAFSVESVLRELPTDRQRWVLKPLLQLELELRATSDAPVTESELAARFPQQSTVIDSVLQNPTPRDSLAERATVPPDQPACSQTSLDSSPTTSGPLRIPRQLGRYRIVRKLGQGAMGSVFLAQDEQLGRPVALKIPRGNVQRSAELRARFLREAQAAAALHHPGICPIYDIGQYEKIDYICMGYIEGLALTRFAVAESGLTEQRIAELILRLAEALGAAHEAGIIHRDLKPANVIVNPNDEPIILDFGLARRVDRNADIRLTQTGMTLGSPAYMSPEQVDGDPQRIGTRSDIYSLGVILYELLTGRIPFEGSTASVLGQIMTREPDKPSEYRPDLSVRLESICLQMMARDPEDRPESMAAVVESLRKYLERYERVDAARQQNQSDVPVAAAQRRQRIEALIAGGDYGQAEKLMIALSRETGDDLIDAATWAAGELPKLRKTREEVRAGRQDIYNTAVRLMKACDYEQTVRLLEEYPYDLRTPRIQELLEQAESRSNEVSRLRTGMRRARSRGDYRQALSLCEQLLELKPSDHNAKALYDQLTRRAIGPLSLILGEHQPTAVEKMSPMWQWVTVCLTVILVSAYPAWSWSTNYLARTRTASADEQTLAAAPVVPAAPTTEQTPGGGQPDSGTTDEPVDSDVATVDDSERQVNDGQVDDTAKRTESAPVRVNLLTGFDPSRVQSHGGWRVTSEGGLTVGKESNTQIAIPTKVPLNYVLHAEFRRFGGTDNVGFTIPLANDASTFQIDAFPDRGGRNGLTLQNATFGSRGRNITNGPLHRLRLEVSATSATSAAVIGVLNDKTIFRWKGNPRELADAHSLAPLNGLCIGAWEGATTFEKLELEYLSDAPKRADGQYLRFAGADSILVSGFNYRGTYPITIEARVTPEVFNSSHTVIGCCVNTGIGLYFDKNGVARFLASNGTKMCEVVADAPCKVGQTVHIAGSCDGKHLRLFVDGNLQKQVTAFNGRFAPGTHFLIGADPSVSGKGYSAIHKRFQGLIHGIHIRKEARVDPFTPQVEFLPDSSSVVCYQLDGINDNFVNNLASDKYLGIIRGARPTNADK